jgi:hypothetical protein
MKKKVVRKLSKVEFELNFDGKQTNYMFAQGVAIYQFAIEHRK